MMLLSQALRDRLLSGRDWADQFGQIATLLKTAAAPEPPGPPTPIVPAGPEPLEEQLSRVGLESPDRVEGLARGALRGGHSEDALLDWALERCDDPVHHDSAAAAATAVIRDRGYRPLLALADREPGPGVRAGPTGPGLHPDLFVVPREAFLLAAGTKRRFAHDYPYLDRALGALPFDHAALFRPETVVALAHERSFLTMLGQATDDEFENSILPLSRVPGLNVLVLAGLLVQELLDPMEVLSWIGADIHNLPRSPRANRPEDIQQLHEPGTVVHHRPVKYMIFSDVHRDAPQDLTFRIGHFSDNEDMFLRALEWCDTNGYTVLEHGDCEELWYVPTFDPAQRQPKLDRLIDIVQLHAAVYAKLADLEARGRYYRCIGNHDSYLWEDPAIVAWRAANPFPAIHGGFIIPQCKTMDDILQPHLGLNPDNYHTRADMLTMHGHQFDFWNCDEHNRLGKFITNAVAVPPDAFDNVVYDYYGIDYLGHPLIKFWDVLTSVPPWYEWPPEDVAREWAQQIENRLYSDNLTQDSIIFSETFAALMGYLMRSGPLSPLNFSVMLCIGHTHNPQCRPWIPFFERFNPWRDDELFGIPVYRNLFALKTRYLSSGTTAWWQHIVWAIEITEQGQPRMVYWSEEDTEPIYMEWELQNTNPLPDPPFSELIAWAKQYLDTDVSAGLDAAFNAPPPQPIAPGGDAAPQLGPAPDLSTLSALLGIAGRPDRPTGLALPPLSAAAMGALSQVGTESELATAGLLLAARRDAISNGGRPTTAPGSAPAEPAVPRPATATSLDLWPLLLTGRPAAARVPSLDLGALLRGQLRSFAPRHAAGGRSAPPVQVRPGLRLRVPGQSRAAPR